MSPPEIHRVALIGVGLIGGSLGLAWKKYRPDLHLVGYDDERVLKRALERGAIDQAAADPARAVADVDLVVLAVPLAAMLPLLEQIAPHLKPGAWVTDVASVKQPVVQHAAEVLPESVVFVGGHPMAGSEHGGIDHADPLLFENATYVLCPPAGTDAPGFEAVAQPLVDLIAAGGGRVLLLEAERHDRIAAAVSHLPQLLAVTLVDFVGTLHASDDAFLRLAAGGFRDLTRIASSPFAVWRDILVGNEGPILDTLASFAAALQRTRNRLIEEDLPSVEETFGRARRIRESIPRNSKGFLHPLADVYVYAEDRPGVLLDITKSLFDSGLNIKDIELLKIREGTGGAFRLSFSSAADAARAVETLEKSDFTAYRL